MGVEGGTAGPGSLGSCCNTTGHSNPGPVTVQSLVTQDLAGSHLLPLAPIQSMPESVLEYLELLVATYQGSATPTQAAVDRAWAGVPLNWRMRIHESCDHQDPAKVLSSAQGMLSAQV